MAKVGWLGKLAIGGLMFRSCLLAMTAFVLAPAAFAQTSSAQGVGPATTAPKPSSTVATVDGITVSLAPASGVSIDRRTYNVTSDVRAATGSLSDVLSNLPSVDFNRQSGVSLRGDPSVTILIDGKPAPQFQGAGQVAALDGMPASLIDRIEVMTTPSAEFTSAGSGGVINIVTKKKVPVGPAMTLSAAYGPEGRTHANASASYGRGALSVTADASLRQDPFPRDIEIASTAPSSTGADVFSRFSNATPGNFDAYGAGLKLAYQLDPKTQVYAGYRINYQSIDFSGAEALSTGPGPVALTPDYLLSLKHTVRYQLNTTTAGFSHNFGGDNHQFTLDFQHSAYPGKENSLTTLVSGSSATPNFQDIVNSWQRDGDSIKAVYRRPMPADGRLVLGTDWQHLDLHSNNFGLQGDDAQSVALNPLLTDRYQALDTQQAFYGTYQQPLGQKLIVLAGVRIETDAVHIKSMGVPAGSQTNVRVNPSLNAAYNLNKDIQLIFGYSRRMNRPAPIQYNPAMVYQTQTSYQQGNPNLKPSTTNSLEATMKYRHADATYTAATYARQNTGATTTVTEPLGSGVFVNRYANLAAKRDAGVELSADGTITKGLKYSFDTNIYHTQTRYAAGVGVDQEGWVESAKANLNWSPTADDLFQVNASAQGRTYLSQGYGTPYGRLNLGYRRKLSTGLFLTVTADDILATDSKYSQVLKAPGLSQRATSIFESRAVLVGLSYAFGGSPGRAVAPPVLDYNGASPGL